MPKMIKMIMVGLLCFLMFSVFTPQACVVTSQTPLEVAEKAANFVASEAVSEGDGYKWPYITSWGNLFYPSESALGATGVGEFMLLLYEKTGNALYMEYAVGAANYLITKAESDAGGYRWGHPDDQLSNWYLVPQVSSTGNFLLKMYLATGNPVYLEYAAGAGRWFMAYAIWEGAGCYIIRNPPQQALHEYKTGGTEEACKLLVHLYSVTNDADYLPYIEGYSHWLMDDAESVDGGYRWLYNRPWAPAYNLVIDCFISTLFYDLYREFGDIAYLHYANGAIEWVLSQAVVVDGKCKWPYSQAEIRYPLTFQSDEGLFELDLVTFGDALLMAYAVTSDPILLNYAEAHAEWIWSQRVEESSGCRFPIEEGRNYYSAHINARICSFFFRISEVTGETSYAQYANSAFAWIVDNATASDGGYKWLTIDRPPYYPVWFLEGAAGIGYYLAGITFGVHAQTDIDPDTLNLRSIGNWITTYIQLPEGYSAENIDATAILLNDTISPVLDSKYDFVTDPDEYLVDHNGDGILERIVKFDRAAVQLLIYDQGFRNCDIALTITGKLFDDSAFEGTDVIAVVTNAPFKR